MKGGVGPWGIALGTALALLSGSAAVGRADVEFVGVMTMDDILVRADFVGVLQMGDAIADAADDYGRAAATIEATWATRWPAATAGSPLTIASTRPIFEPASRAVVFLSGGPWEDSPLTFDGGHFEVRDDRVLCADGTTLYDVGSDGFVCSIQLHIDGAPLSLDEFRARVDLRRERARSRMSALAAALDVDVRPLETRPTSASRGH